MLEQTETRSRSSRWGVALIVVALSVSLVLAEGSLRGTTVDEAGNPLAGVKVQMIPANPDLPTISTKSNKKGKFVFGLIRNADYRLVAFKDGMRIYRVDAELSVPDDDSRWSYHKDIPAGSVLPEFKIDGVTKVTYDIKFKKTSGAPGHYGTGEAAAATNELIELIQGGETETAIEQISRSIEDRPDSPNLHYLMAFARRAGGDLPGALESIDTALSHDAEFEGASVLKAKILEESGDSAAAVEWYVKETEQAESFEVKRDAYIGLAIAYEHLERIPEAVGVLERLIDLAPDNTAALKELAQLYIRLGEQEKANALLEQVTMMGDADPNILYNLGADRYNAGDLDKAAEYFQQVIEMAPDFADAHLRLAYTQLGQGKSAEAVASLERFIELSPDDHPEKETARNIHAQLSKQ